MPSAVTSDPRGIRAPCDPDRQSSGYDSLADRFVAVRSASGTAVARAWAAKQPREARIIDVGAGSGIPITKVLVEAGLMVSAIDGSPRMVALFRENFPAVPVRCGAIEDIPLSASAWDGVIAVGLIFLLPEDVQRKVIKRFADALVPGGSLLFSAPREVGTWDDTLTGRPSMSLGYDAYRDALANANLRLNETYTDENGSHYYEAVKP